MSPSDSVPSRRPRLLVALAVTAAVAGTAVVAGAAASAAPPTAVRAAAPAAPTDVVVTDLASRSVTLSWTAPPGDVAGYQVSYSSLYTDVPGGVMYSTTETTFTYPGLGPTGMYIFAVYAVDSQGAVSPPSAMLPVATPVSDTGPDTVPPTTPANLRQTGSVPGGVELSWSPATDNVGVTGYDVFHFDGWYVSRLVGTATGTTYTAPRPPTTSGSFYVRARDAAGNLSFTSNTTSSYPSIPPSTPPVPTATCRAAYQVTTEWTSGFVANLTITNTGTVAVDGWTLRFTYGGDQRIKSSWPGSSSQSGKEVTIESTRWNRVLAVGASTTVGLSGSWRRSNAPPTAFTLNGSPCLIG